MRLPRTTYKWALRHLLAEGDSDLFPCPLELEALNYSRSHGVLDDLADFDVASYAWRGGRRFVVPKNLLAFRQGTQLHPMDSLVFAALIKKLGRQLERHRDPLSEGRVFSYRFAPTSDGRFYGTDTKWHDFWRVSKQKARRRKCKRVLVADISDFYNQIYHHVIDNQLSEAGLTEVQRRIFMRFLSTYSETASREIPIGPHSVHLLAELSLHPIDQELVGRGYEFCRYVDDFHLFCSSQENAVSALYDLANSLDAQQRLSLATSKTEILSADQFIERADGMLIDNPVNEDERDVLDAISRHTNGDPYVQVSLGSLGDSELERLSSDVLGALLSVYLQGEPIDYSRIGWLIRRLRQVGAPGALDFVVKNLADLTPILGGVARYIMSAVPNYDGDTSDLGDRLVSQFDLPVVSRSPYLQLVLLDVLASVPALDHAEAVTARYETNGSAVRREILRVAAANGLGSWLRGRKHEFRGMDPWLRAAYLWALPSLPGDESEHWLRSIKRTLSPLERLVVRYAFRDRELKLGSTKLS